MKRRDFLQKLGIGAAACAVLPSIIKEEEPFTVEKLKATEKELGIQLSDDGFMHANNYDIYIKPQAYQEIIAKYDNGLNEWDFFNLNRRVL